MNEEEELKEEKDRYERQNQEAYDEVTKGNEELRRKQEERKKKGLLDEGSAFRQAAAIGTEVGLNTILDLFSFEPGSQIAGGSAINYLAQRIRGGEFSKGEMIASGLASLIPGGAQGKALARTAKGIGKGAVSGAIETTGMTTIDEGRLPTAEELATGAGIGGAFGGLFTTAANTQQIKELAKRVKTGTGNIAETLTPGPLRIARDADLIGAAKFGGTSGSAKGGKAKTYPVTRENDLGLYGADDSMFEVAPSTVAALSGGSKRGGRFVKVPDPNTGDTYYTVFTRGGKTQILPYNTWYQKNVNPFKVPDKLLETWRKSESGQQLNLLNINTKTNPFGAPMLSIPYGTKGKTRKVVAPTRYPKGTVDTFNDWYKGVFKLQKEEQKLNRQVSIMLEQLGNIEARNPGKKVFDTDLSHIAPRSKGGSGLTFQEAWILNQGRGADDILSPSLLARAGIPRNWDELFNYWLMQQKKGKEFQTAIGPLEHINVDDYFALSKGEPLSVVGRRRQNIRNLVERQQGDFETYTYAGKIRPENDIGDDFTDLVRESKAAQPGGATYMINQNLLDLRYVADNYEDLLDLGEI